MFNLDANHDEIKTAFLMMGCKVMDLARARHYTDGTLDLAVGIPDPDGRRAGTIILVEVKTAGGRVRATQQRVIDEWSGAGLPVEVVRNTDDVIAVYFKYRRSLWQHGDAPVTNTDSKKD